MNKNILKRIAFYVGVVLVAYFGNVALQSYWGRQAIAEIGFEPISLDQAKDKAKAESKYVLADLSAVWCPSCRAMDKTVLANQTVQQVIDTDFVFTRLELETKEGQAFKEKYKLKGIPHVLVLTADGELVGRVTQLWNADGFKQELSALTKQAGPTG